MSDVAIYHNPRCSKSRAGLAAAGPGARVVEYLKTPPSTEELTALLAILEDPPSALVRRDALFKELGLTAGDVASAEQVAAVLARHPKLMERPVLVREGRAIIGRPVERVAPFLAGE